MRIRPSPALCMLIALTWFGAVPELRAAFGDSGAFLLDTRDFGDSTPLFTVDTRSSDLVANTGIVDPGGASIVLTMAMLQVTGGADAMDTITFTLVGAPSHGTLRLNGGALGLGGTFTQADVDGGLVDYVRGAGTALSDIFALSAVDELGFGLLSGTLDFAVAGDPSSTGILFLVDTRDFGGSGEFAVHTDSRAYLSADQVPGSLRQAIANTAASGTVVLDSALDDQIIALTPGPLVVDKALSLDKSAVPNGLILSGNQANSILHVAAGGALTIDSMTLTEGQSSESGGAIVNDGNLTLANVTIHKCAAFADGGGILNTASATLELINTTVAGNFAIDSGGGIYNSGTLSVIHSSISDNEAFFLGSGGIFNNGGTVALENSIVAGNVAAFADNLGSPPDTATGNNLTTGHAGLAPLGDYGGPTPTMPPLPGSVAIEGAVLLASTPATDQLGNVRPLGPLPDLGAVEAIAFSSLPLADSEPDGIPDLLEPAYPQFTIGIDDSALDSDGDGMTDAEELGDMTDPLDGSDSFRIIRISPAATFDAQTNPLMTVTIATFPGLRYSLQTDATLQSFRELPHSAFTATDYTTSLEILLGSGRDFVRGKRE